MQTVGYNILTFRKDCPQYIVECNGGRGGNNGGAQNGKKNSDKYYNGTKLRRQGGGRAGGPGLGGQALNGLTGIKTPVDGALKVPDRRLGVWGAGFLAARGDGLSWPV